jgi:hypothetical protein
MILYWVVPDLMLKFSEQYLRFAFLISKEGVLSSYCVGLGRLCLLVRYLDW